MATKPLSILILTVHFGAGHMNASEALRLSLEKEGIETVTVMDFFELTVPRLNIAVQIFYAWIIRWLPFSYGVFYTLIDRLRPNSWFQRLFNRLCYKKMLAYLNEHQPNIVICMYPTPSGVLSCLKQRKDFRGMVTVITTDYQINSHWIHPHVDLYIVANATIRDKLIRQGFDDSNIVVSGIPINPNFCERSLSSPQDFGLQPEIPVIAVLSGGYSTNTVLGIVKACLDSEPKIQLLIQYGDNYRLESRLRAINKNNPQISMTSHIERMDKLMAITDVLITKAGGVTLTEAFAMQLPVIVYRPAHGQESGNASLLDELGAIKVAHSYSELTQSIRRLQNNPIETARIKYTISQLADPCSAIAAARQILTRFYNDFN